MYLTTSGQSSFGESGPNTLQSTAMFRVLVGVRAVALVFLHERVIDECGREAKCHSPTGPTSGRGQGCRRWLVEHIGTLRDG